MFTADAARMALRNAGLRVTPQRLMIIGVLVGNRSHPTVEDIYAKVQAQYPAISLATVYHTLSMLSQQGMILELHGGKDGLRCDPNTDPHAHAYCEGCGKIFDIPLHEISVCEAGNGFIPTRTEISFYGHCTVCAQL